MSATFQELDSDLTAALADDGFTRVESPKSAALLLIKKTWNVNRAVARVELDSLPEDLGAELERRRLEIGREARYTPVLYGLGLQLIVCAPGLTAAGVDPQDHVSVADNQRVLIQSLVFIDSETFTLQHGRSWGQVVTGKTQDRILQSLIGSLTPLTAASSAGAVLLCVRCGDSHSGPEPACESCREVYKADREARRTQQMTRVLVTAGGLALLLFLVAIGSIGLMVAMTL